MKNIIPSFLFSFCICICAFSQTSVIKTDSKSAQIELLSSENNITILKIKPGDFWLESVAAGKIPHIVNGTPLLQKGDPELDKLTTSLIIPDVDEMQIELISSSFTEMENIEIAPSKGTLSRIINPSEVPYVKGSAYNQDSYFPASIAFLREPYIFRDYRGQALVIVPFQYNPVQKKLKVYTEMTIKIFPAGKNGMNPFVQKRSDNISDPLFNACYSRHFINYINHNKYTPIGEYGNMLIISHGPFMADLEPFVAWKKQKGIQVEMVDVADIGGAEEIKSYVAQYYNTKGLTWLLLVGDHQQVPCFAEPIGMSDNSYGYITGNDHYPEIITGRFSAESSADVQTQVLRTINYEKYPDPAGTWYKNSLGLATTEGPGDDSELDFEHIRNIRTDLLNFTYTTGDEQYQGSQGGQDSTGDPVAADVLNFINTKGYGIINYTGHGWDQGWGTSGFSNNEVAQITNTEQLPFIFSVACVNGNFTNLTCFAEAWMRASYAGEPAGAIGALMSTINQYWSEPMHGQDEMDDLVCGLIPGTTEHTFGSISMSGCMEMNDAYGQGGYDMTDTWNLFGDPSVVVRTDTPVPMITSHAASLELGTQSTIVSCNTENALVCLTLNGEILGTGMITSGNVTISFPALAVTDTILLTITAFNKMPYFGEIAVVPPVSGPFVIMNIYNVDDPSDNHNHLADYGENIYLNVDLKNAGIADAVGVSGTLASTDSYVTITGSANTWGDIAAGADVMLNNAFSVSVADSFPDQHLVHFAVNATDGGTTWVSGIDLILNAPVLKCGVVGINDTGGGNGNGILEPGETVILEVEVKNTGHADALVSVGTILTTCPEITVNNSSYSIGTIPAEGSAIAQFNISVSPAALIGTLADFSFTCSAGPYQKQKDYFIMIGQFSENWETGDFSQFTWVPDPGIPWIITDSIAYEGSYCARSGIITHNGSTQLEITADVLVDDSISFYRKVSSEAGWDWLTFYIDGSVKGQWSGEQDWARVIYPVAAGNHTFTWGYTKDYVDYDPIGSDCGWVDYILFPPVAGTITSAAPAVSEKAGLNLSCYPNPASDILYIDFSLEQQGPVRLIFMNSLGQPVGVIKNEQLQKGNYHASFDISQFPQGMYFVQMISNGSKTVKKVSVIR